MASSAAASATEGTFVRFTSMKIRSEEEYEKRLGFVRRCISADDCANSARWWTLMEMLDMWEMEDMNPDIGPPGKKRKWETSGEEPETSSEVLGVQSPPPGLGLQANRVAQAGAASSSSLPLPTTPPELLADKTSWGAAAKAELIAKNKAAALLRLWENMNSEPEDKKDAGSKGDLHYL